MAKDNKKQKERKKPAQGDSEAPKQEAPQVTEVAPKEAPKAAPPKIDFDAWFIMRKSKIPLHHHKEIVKADFKGRGLGQCESMEDFDAALKKYGVKLG